MNIDLEKLEIEVKSTHENYVKESSGASRATVRILDEEEWTAVKQLEALAIKHPATLVLIDKDTGDDVRRKITDITLIGDLCGKAVVKISFTDIFTEPEKSA